MRITKSIAGISAVAALTLGSLAYAGQEDRRAGMKEIGKAAKALSSGGDAVANANILIAQAQAIAANFETEEISGDSTALPKIWEDYAGFTAKAKDLETAAMAVLAAAESGGDVAGAAKAMGATCGACHSNYRVKK